VAHALSPPKSVPDRIVRPPYAAELALGSPYSGLLFQSDHQHRDDDDAERKQDGEQFLDRMRTAARLARRTLDAACDLASPGVTTDEIDTRVHDALIQAGAYPSPLNYAGFPKSLCASVNEVICHGIPDSRPLRFGDVVSFDVSCYVGGVHGDNCATVIVGDRDDDDDAAQAEPLDDDVGDDNGKDWRGVPYRTKFDNDADEEYFWEARRLVRTARESLYAGISVCRPGGCLSDIGAAVQDVADREGYSSVRKYRGHGIGTELHCAPYVRHYKNDERIPLVPGMVFTVRRGSARCLPAV